MSRHDGRRPDQLRPLELVVDYLEQPLGSVLYSQGKTRVLCTASLDEHIPRWLRGSGRGWLTAEYSLLPASTGERTQREASAGKQKGRTVEIQRLIGRALRAVTDLEALGERTLWIDCDVLQADGGTRCAAISGAYVAAAVRSGRRALARADRLGRSGVGRHRRRRAAARSRLRGGLERRGGRQRREDGGRLLVEVQATAERAPFARDDLDAMLDLAEAGITTIREAQEAALDAAP